MADLVRMRNTLWLVPKLFWILIEDSPKKTYKMSKYNTCLFSTVVSAIFSVSADTTDS